MELNELQKNYLKKAFYRTGGSDYTILKPDFVEFAQSLDLEVKKKFTKDEVINLIFDNGYGDKLYERFYKGIDVTYWDVAKIHGLTYKQISDLQQLEVIEALEYTGYKDCTLYPLSVLGFAPGELLEIWNNKNKTDFHRTRIDIKDAAEIESIVDQLSKAFEVENVSKPYPHREYNGFYIYLSIRSLNAAVTNDNFKNQENAKLKLENSTLKGTIEKLNSKISQIEWDSRSSEAYKDLNKRLTEYHDKYWDLKGNEYKIERLEKQIAGLEEKLKSTPTGGRPEKFTVQEKETMKMYRLQGQSIRYIAKTFECSTGLVHKIINE